MTYARKSLVSQEDTAHYHVVARCVRRAWLRGFDKYAGRDFSHRKRWVLERLQLLTGMFAIDVCAYAILSNHYHLVLHVGRARAQVWSQQRRDQSEAVTLSNAFSMLLRGLESEDVETVREACLDAAYLLERHAFNSYTDETYVELFRLSDLLGFRLDGKSHDEIVARLGGILDRRMACADVAAWAAGKSRDPELRRKLVTALKHYASIELDDFVYQIIVALESYGLDDEAIELIREVSTKTGMTRSSTYASEIVDA